MPTPLTFGSLFAGIGGFDIGFERAGMQCRWQVEKDEYCQRVLARHWPDVGRWDDVCTFPPAPAEDWAVDLICGGDPCQAHSAATCNSTHASFGGEFVRVVDELRPRIVVRENPTHARTDAPWTWWRFRTALESLGYAVLPFRLRACCFGAEHQRDRLFLLAEHTNANGDRLERRQTKPDAILSAEPEGLVDAADWLPLPSTGGYDSRTGIPGYVDQMRALGNALVPQIAEWLGQRIVMMDAERR